METTAQKQEGRRFSWLHFSDFQFESRTTPTYRKAKCALYRDLGRLHDLLGPWHAVFVTGDLTASGRPTEYDRAENELGDLLACLGKLGRAPQVLVVPGNHDVDRSNVRPSERGLLRRAGEDPSMLAELLGPTSLYREIFDKLFGPYVAWSECSALVTAGREGIVPGDFSASVPGQGCQVEVVGLNSASVQLADEDYYGRLALDAAQFDAVCGGKAAELGDQCDTSLLLTHHSPGWLSPPSRSHLHSRIAPIGRFAAHLCASFGGKRPWEDCSAVPGQTVIQCRPFHGRGERGYVAGSVALDEEGAILRVWPRVLPRRGKGFRSDRDYAYDLTDGDHFPVKLPSPGQEGLKLVATPKRGGLAANVPVELEYLELRNFRCFEKLLVPFRSDSVLPGRWTCVVGINGSGKSTVLEALCLALIGRPLIRELGGRRLERMRRKGGGRLHDAELRLWLRRGRRPEYLELRLDESGSYSREVALDWEEFWQEMRSRLFVAYGATRNLAASREPSREDLSPDLLRLMTVFDPLTELASAEALLRSPRGKGPVKELLTNLIAQVFEGELVSVVQKGRLRFVVEDEPLEAIDLPDGFRSSVAWMADLCATWAEKDPRRAKNGNPSEIEGLVMIDEIALHLHPSLQRTMVPRLRAALPHVQWVVTTHSPLVLSSFDSREIVALDRQEADGIRKLDRQIMGFSTDEVVRWLMETPPSSGALEEALDQPGNADHARDLVLDKILRSSPDLSEAEAEAEAKEFQRLLARIGGPRS